MRHIGGQCHFALFSKVHILGNAPFTRKPIDHQNGECGTVAACDVCAKGSIEDVLVFLLWSGTNKRHLISLFPFQRVEL